MAQRQIRSRGGHGRPMVTAEHVSRLDVNGNPQIKTFTQAAWDAIPKRHYFDKTGIHDYERGGWVPTSKVRAEVPKRLKATPTEKVVPTTKAQSSNQAAEKLLEDLTK